MPARPDTLSLQPEPGGLISPTPTDEAQSLAETAADLGIELQDDQILVVTENDMTVLPKPLATLGDEVYPITPDRLSLLAPTSTSGATASLNGGEYARRPLPTHGAEMPQAGDVTSEGVATIGADTWHEAGFDGSGVTAAIVDTGFAGWQSLQASGELPTSTHCVDLTGGTDCGDTGDQYHGSAMAEVLYDTAPGIDTLYLYTLDSMPEADLYTITEQLTATVNHMVITASVDVASMGLNLINGGPYDGSGPFAQEVNRAREEGDIFWTVAAGNTAQRHYEATFDEGDCQGYHDFDPAPGEDHCAELNRLSYRGQGEESKTVCLYLEWNDWPTTDQDYNLHAYYLLWGEYPVEIWSSEDAQDDTPPVEGGCFDTVLSGAYYFSVEQQNANGNHYFEVFLTTSDGTDDWTNNLGVAVTESSILEPATADWAVAVGAFNYITPTVLESFSAHGPRNPAGGGPYNPDVCGTTPMTACKVDFAGPDGVSTVSYGPEAFHSTSAAAAHVAGAAALVWSAFPDFGRDDVYNYLRQQAPTPGTRSTNKDPGWGWGRVQLGIAPTAVELLNFQAKAEADGVHITWETASEVDLVGFNIYRSVVPSGEPVRLNPYLIPPQAPGSSFGGTYSWLDEDVEPGTTYAYLLEDRDVSGALTPWGPVKVNVPAHVYLPLLVR